MGAGAFGSGASIGRPDRPGDAAGEALGAIEHDELVDVVVLARRGLDDLG